MKPSAVQLDEFFSSKEVSWLIANAREDRALKIAFPKEVNISKLFGWLFDANEGHGLGDLAIKTLLLKAWRAANEDGKPERVTIRPTQVHQVSFANTVVLSEFTTSDATNRLDLVLVDRSNKLLVGIENKYGARQGHEQLKRYADALTKLTKDRTDWHLVMVLLDSDEYSQPEDPRWVKLSYEWVTELIREELERGHLSEASAATLRQFGEHLEDEGLAPYPRLTHTDAIANIQQLSHDHKEVIASMQALSQLEVVQYVEQLLEKEPGPLALEFIRHRQLWEHVLETGKRAELLVPLQKRFKDIDSDFASSRCQSYFSRRSWHEHWKVDEGHEEEAIWPLYVSLYQSKRVKKHAVLRVSAMFIPQSIFPEHRQAYLTQALKMRESNKLSNRGVRRDAPHIQLARYEFEADLLGQAMDKLMLIVEEMDKAFKGLWAGHQALVS